MFDKKSLDRIKAGKKKWEQETVSKTLSKAPERKDNFTSISNTPIERLYTPMDVARTD
jgi:methylmalonyl-CoA mutase N-terminal domain/subunit